MSFQEVPIVFDCESEELLGILHTPDTVSEVGVLVVVGGPQYRVGSHRQFVLLARDLAVQGLPVFRFDYRGMGDSAGETNFENAGSDIRAAIDQFVKKVPEIKKIVIWGLCDAASAALFYAYQDKRVNGVILLNPWVRTEESVARTYLKHYYLQRLINKDLWLKILQGKFNIWGSLKSFFGLVRDAQSKSSDETTAEQLDAMPLPERMFTCFNNFKGKSLIILSGKNDYVANEFRDVVSGSEQWQRLTRQDSVTIQEITDANHTFSSEKWRGMVSRMTIDWLKRNSNL